MGKSTRKRQAELEQREQKVVNRFALQAATQKPKPGILTVGDILSAKRSGRAKRSDTQEYAITTIVDMSTTSYIRDLHSWSYSGKSARIDKQLLSLLRYLYAIYPVPRFLEEAAMDRAFTSWYLAVAQGKSLYKECTRGLLSKRETHLFLQAPANITATEAVWWAKTMAICDDVGVAYRMARCAIVHRGNYTEDFWIDLHRFFTVNLVQLSEMGDLIDYIESEHRGNNNWSIKKRSLESIRRKSEIWHRAVFKMAKIGGGSWKGMTDIPTWHHTTGSVNQNPQKNTLKEWTITQILTGNDLVKEGQRMHHCVGSYKSACMAGSSAIFSMTSSSVLAVDKRNLTIEVRGDLHSRSRKIVQARGYANRTASQQEMTILNTWARENNISQFSGWRY